MTSEGKCHFLANASWFTDIPEQNRVYCRLRIGILPVLYLFTRIVVLAVILVALFPIRAGTI